MNAALLAAILAIPPGAFIPGRYIASQATAAPSDAPLLTLGDQLETPVVELPQGAPVPWDATCLTKTQAMKTAKAKASCEATLAEAESKVLIPLPALVLSLAGALVVGAAVGAAVALAIPKRQ